MNSMIEDMLEIIGGTFLVNSHFRLTNKGADNYKISGLYVGIPSINSIRWLLPVHSPKLFSNMFEFYHPVRLSNKFFKYLITSAVRFKCAKLFFRSNILANIENRRFQDYPLKDIFKKLFQQSNVEISLSINSEIQKAIVIIMTPIGKILGYSKIGFSNCAKELIDTEYNTLQKLANMNLINGSIPKVISFEEKRNTMFLVESCPEKGWASGPLDLTEKHLSFLSEIFNKTKIKRKIKNSAVYRKVHIKIRQNIDLVSQSWRNRLQKGIKLIDSMKNVEVPMCLFHGDFVPWNLLFVGEEKKLYITDWEYSEEALPVWDIFHFVIHTGVLIRNFRENKLSDSLFKNKNIVNFYKKIYPEIMNDYQIFKLNFLFYLFNISLRYLDYWKIVGRLDRQTKKILNVLGAIIDGFV